MHPDYTEEDSARARAAEHSSAGADTSRLALHPDAAPRLFNQINPAAVVLIVVGVLMLASHLFGGVGLLGGGFMEGIERSKITGGMTLMTMASCFLFFAFWRRIYGLLIPGAILFGLGMGVPFSELSKGTSVLWGLALGFLAIELVGRTWFGVRRSWPIIPAVVLFGVGTISAVNHLPLLLAGGLLWLPLLLIAAGVVLGSTRHAARATR